MTKTAKVLLVLTIVCLVAGGAFNMGLIEPGNLTALYVLLPVGAVFLGLFLIVLVLEKESAKSQEDEHLPEPASEGPAKPLPPTPGHKELAHEQSGKESQSVISKHP
jgi:hypothetical protein